MNELGDLTIVWDEDQDAVMMEIIQKKLDEGCTFYIIEPRLGGLAAPKKTRLRNAESALQQRALAIPDADLRQFVGMGKGDVVKTPEAPVKMVRRSKNAKEIAGSQSVGVKPRAGG